MLRENVSGDSGSCCTYTELYSRISVVYSHVKRGVLCREGQDPVPDSRRKECRNLTCTHASVITLKHSESKRRQALNRPGQAASPLQACHRNRTSLQNIRELLHDAIPTSFCQRITKSLIMSLLQAHLEQISMSCQGIDSLP